ncbi:InlB B-repeat-containing protein, partial [Paramuribaculum intestinale]|uniref:InlB B-repeat-containing protein n=1 Tax=Paramuribaculum intestinale TaxID=2094151 RepID=UPI003EBF8F90
MRKTLLSILMAAALPAASFAQDYCTVSGTANNQDRYVSNIAISDDQGNSGTIEGVETVTNSWSGTTQGARNRSIYYDHTDNVFTTAPGATITVTPNGSANWMHNYLYVDFGQDGTFDVDLSNTGINGDLVSHTGYNLAMKSDQSDTADPSVWSDGTTIASTPNGYDNVLGNAMPSFTLPADMAPGRYRVRYKLDWNSSHPCGRTSSNLHGGQSGNYIVDNRGAMIDFTIEIPETGTPTTPCALTVNADDYLTYTITDPDGSTVTDLTSLTTGTEYTLTATSPFDQYFVMSVTLDGGTLNPTETEGTYTFTLDGDATLTLTRGSVLQLGIVNGNNGTHGSLTVTDGTTTYSIGNHKIKQGTELTVNATANSGYKLDYIYDAFDNSNVFENGSTFTLNKSMYLAADFIKVYTLTVINNTEATYTITDGFGNTLDDLTQMIGDGRSEYTLTLSGVEGQTIKVLLDGEELEASYGKYLFTMTGDATLTINAVSTYTVAILSGEHGTMTATDGTNEYGLGQHRILGGTELTFNINPEEGYTLKNISNQANGTSLYENTVTVNADMYLQPNFVRSCNLTMVNDGNATYTITYEIGEGQTKTVTDLTTMLADGTEYTLTVNVPEGKEVKSVTLGSQTLEASNGVYTFTLSEAAETLTIKVGNKPGYVVTIVQPVGGTIAITTTDGTPVNSGDEVEPGTTINLSNTANEHYSFAYYQKNGGSLWTDMDVVRAATTYSAVFWPETLSFEVTNEENAEYTLTDVNGNAINAQMGIAYGTEVTLTVTEPEGKKANVTLNGTELEGTDGVFHFTMTDHTFITITFSDKTVEYCIPEPVAGRKYGTETRRRDRYVSSLTVKDGDNTLSISGPGSAPANGTREVYFDMTDHIFTTEAGKEITVTVAGSGEWMNTGIYVDFDLDGFTKAGDELVNNNTG